MYEGKMIHVSLYDGNETILYVKKKIEARKGIPAHRQTLSFQGEILDDGESLPSFHLCLKQVSEWHLRDMADFSFV
jgi:hypothetical protein